MQQSEHSVTPSHQTLQNICRLRYSFVQSGLNIGENNCFRMIRSVEFWLVKIFKFYQNKMNLAKITFKFLTKTGFKPDMYIKSSTSHHRGICGCAGLFVQWFGVYIIRLTRRNLFILKKYIEGWSTSVIKSRSEPVWSIVRENGNRNPVLWGGGKVADCLLLMNKTRFLHLRKMVISVNNASTNQE